MFLADLSRRVAGQGERQRSKRVIFHALNLSLMYRVHDIVCQGFSNVVAPHCAVMIYMVIQKTSSKK